MSTPYHAKLLALQLTRRAEFGSPEVFARALSDAQVDLNPHQVDAALFAARSPISKGAILADEVGLGKTIEAALLLAQRWAERRRKLLVIVPASLRKQWSMELMDKFHLPSVILERRTIFEEQQKGNFNPFNQKVIVIVSYPFAAKHNAFIRHIEWDMVVIDEAHRLRNVYRPTAKNANAIKNAVADRFKVLLTATPLQNSLLELFGLVSVIDEFHFGSLDGFKQRYGKGGAEASASLKERLSLISKRTLRTDVRQFVKFTKRVALVQEFTSSADEAKLYQLVSEYLQRDNLYALPNQQRQLMTMVLRKLLASSTYAIANTLEGLCRKLQELIDRSETPPEPIPGETIQDVDYLEESKEEWEGEEDGDEGTEKAPRRLSAAEKIEAQQELDDLQKFADLARQIRRNSKGDVLVDALKAGFARADEAQAGQASIQRKAIIFTESRRTQEYLREVLESEEGGFKGKVVLFNGSNTDPESKRIYENWLRRKAGTDQISESKTADMRAALVDYFREEGEIMLATEAAAEGINLQFCNLVVNFDLPWNPQRIEQRIGRCHRYGQKCDVVVVNFVNKSNAADQRVYELLQSKFKLFNSVFGASDEILGQVDSTGISFEKRINDIYQSCRSKDEIEAAFAKLERELEDQIRAAKDQARTDLMNNFDQSVVEKVKIGTERSLDAVTRKLWQLTRYSLADYATFADDRHRFELRRLPAGAYDISTGTYEITKVPAEGVHIYRIGHPLSQHVINRALAAETPPAHLRFGLSRHAVKISALERFLGQSGWLEVAQVTAQFGDGQSEDHILLVAASDSGEAIDPEAAASFFDIAAEQIGAAGDCPPRVRTALDTAFTAAAADHAQAQAARTKRLLQEESAKLDAWEEDQRATFKAFAAEVQAALDVVNRKLGLTADAREELELEEEKIRLKRKRTLEDARYQAQCGDLEEKKLNLLRQRKALLQSTQESRRHFAIRWTLE